MIWSREVATPAFWQRYSTSLNSSGPRPTASPATRTSRAARAASTSPERGAVPGGAAEERDGRVGLAHVCLKPRDQLGAAEGLGDEVVSTRVEGPGDGGLVGPAGEEHDRQQRVLGAKLPADVDARAVGETPVDD